MINDCNYLIFMHIGGEKEKNSRCHWFLFKNKLLVLKF